VEDFTVIVEDFTVEDMVEEDMVVDLAEELMVI